MGESLGDGSVLVVVELLIGDSIEIYLNVVHIPFFLSVKASVKIIPYCKLEFVGMDGEDDEPKVAAGGKANVRDIHSIRVYVAGSISSPPMRS